MTVARLRHQQVHDYFIDHGTGYGCDIAAQLGIRTNHIATYLAPLLERNLIVRDDIMHPDKHKTLPFYSLAERHKSFKDAEILIRQVKAVDGMAPRTDPDQFNPADPFRRCRPSMATKETA